MLLELMSASSLGLYNIPLAHRVGLQGSIYFSVLLDINTKLLHKAKDEGGYFKIDRSYIYQKTTLSPEEQERLEQSLVAVLLLERHPTQPSLIKVNADVLVAMLSDDSESLEKAVERLAAINRPKKTRKQTMIDTMRRHVMCSNEDLRAAYYRWIDAVVNKTQWMSATSVEEAQRLIDQYSNRYLDVALSVLNIAEQNGWRDVSYAIEKHQKQTETSTALVFTPSEQVEQRQEVSEEVF